MFRALALLLTCVCTLPAQGRVPEEFLGERIMAIVPIVGQGTPADPFRPMFTPKPGEMGDSKFTSIQFELSDDGKSALAEFVARDKAAFREILAAKGPEVKVFERGKNTKEELEREFSKVKRDYKFRQLGTEGK